MTSLEWFLVIGINGAIILFGIFKGRGTKRSVDWFLAAKGLPWWMVGLSMFATAVDSGDYVAIAGESYREGMSYISAWWLGMTVGWLMIAYVVLLPMYRNGMFTNAEYLEFRFGPAARLISVFIQIQYRTNVLANVAYSLYLTFRTVTDWSERTLWGVELTWWFVGAIALGAAAYTASGGLKSVAVTDSLQSVVMLIASLVLWWTVWNAVGGWSSLQQRLEQQSPALADAMLHVGSDYDPGVPPATVVEREVPAGLMVFGWTIVLTAYCVVNHSQAMRMLAARSVWDMKMAAVLAGAVTMVVMWFNVTLGILGRAIFPDLTATDQIFPQLIDRFLTPGLLGLVIAGVLFGVGLIVFQALGFGDNPVLGDTAATLRSL